MEYKRNIRFQYFQIHYFTVSAEGTKVSESKLFDLVKWIEKIKHENLEKRAIDIGDAKARIDRCKYDAQSGFWAIRFMRLRDTNIPSIVKENQEAEVIELDDDEYIGEDVTLLYEKSSGIAMIQCNRFSLGVSKIEQFLWKTYGNTEIYISIMPILNKNAGKFSPKNFYRTFEVSFANVNKWDPNDCKGRALASIMNLAKRFDSYTGKITISLGHSGANTLSQNEAVEFICDLQENREFIRSAKVKQQKVDGTEDDSNGVELIDIFENIIQDVIPFVCQSKETLDFNAIVAEMSYFFNKKKDELYSAVQFRVE